MKLFLLFFFESAKHQQKQLWGKKIYPPWNWQFAPENGWLEYDRFLLGQKVYFQGASQLLVSGSGLFLKTKVEEFQVILEHFHVGEGWVFLADGFKCAFKGREEDFPFPYLVYVSFGKDNWVVVSNIFYRHPYLGKMNPIWLIFFRWVENTNQFFWGVTIKSAVRF